jgi:hypothetical protein
MIRADESEDPVRGNRVMEGLLLGGVVHVGVSTDEHRPESSKPLEVSDVDGGFDDGGGGIGRDRADCRLDGSVAVGPGDRFATPLAE